VKSPKVGIFWLVKGRLLIDSTPAHEAEDYAHFKTHAVSHIDHWRVLQNVGTVPSDMEYEECPRGRVMYDQISGQFSVLADKCILKERILVRKIATALDLPTRKTKWGSDEHYRCSSCLGRAV
jgi:hypothetical protein